MCTVSLTVMLFACKKKMSLPIKLLSNNLTTVHLNLNFKWHTQVCTVYLAKMLQVNVAVINHLMIKRKTQQIFKLYRHEQ